MHDNHVKCPAEEVYKDAIIDKCYIFQTVHLNHSCEFLVHFDEVVPYVEIFNDNKSIIRAHLDELLLISFNGESRPHLRCMKIHGMIDKL